MRQVHAGVAEARRPRTTPPAACSRAPRRPTGRRPRAPGYCDTMRSACSDQMSLIGFEPWYAGRSAGRSGRGRSVNGIAVNDSMAWLRMSSPLDAATCGGIVRVFSGSRIAERRLQPAVGDAGLRVQLRVVEDRRRRSSRCPSPRSSESRSAASAGRAPAAPCRSAGSRSRGSPPGGWRRGWPPSRCRSSSRRRRRRTRRIRPRSRTRSRRGTTRRSAPRARDRRAHG